ncbi:MAG: DUF5683 domain-containing protein [Bacteroidales bacterium]|nr:DUF5683 domain-containing protein [Bacteroidales bacterium]
MSLMKKMSSCYSIKIQWKQVTFFIVLCLIFNLIQAQTETDTLINKIEQTIKEQYKDFEKQELDSIRQAEKQQKKFIKDSLREHHAWHPDPKKATLWALLPGAGQAYNHKYWKMPIVYAGFGTITYLIIRYTNQFQEWNNAYLYKATNGERGKYNHYVDVYDQAQLQSMKEFYQSNREWCYFAGVVLYVLQIIDASVDAHLYNFNVSDDLSLHLAPIQPIVPENISFQPPQQNLGITITYHLGK